MLFHNYAQAYCLNTLESWYIVLCGGGELKDELMIPAKHNYLSCSARLHSGRAERIMHD